MSALNGRIDRKTFIAGNLIAFGAFIFAVALIMVPLAVLDLFINAKFFDEVISVVVYAIIFPGIFYYIYFAILIIRRAHDMNIPGFLIVVGFSLLLVIGKILALPIFNLLAFIIFAVFCLKKGSKKRNNFGPVPSKKFKPDNLKVSF